MGVRNESWTGEADVWQGVVAVEPTGVGRRSGVGDWGCRGFAIFSGVSRKGNGRTIRFLWHEDDSHGATRMATLRHGAGEGRSSLLGVWRIPESAGVPPLGEEAAPFRPDPDPRRRTAAWFFDS